MRRQFFQSNKVPLPATFLCCVLILLCPVFSMRAEAIEGIQQQHYLMDENHVDLVSGFTSFSVPDVSIGGERSLSHILLSQVDGFPGGAVGQDNFSGRIELRTAFQGVSYCAIPPDPPDESHTLPGAIVIVGRASEAFCLANSVYSARGPTGSTLVANADGTYTYVVGTGIAYTFDVDRRLVRVLRPDGLDVRITFVPTGRVRAITRNDGFQLLYNYVTVSGPPTYSELTSIVAVNNAFQYCDPNATTCSISGSWPTAQYTYSGNTFTVTDRGGQQTRFTQDSQGRVVGLRLPTTSGGDNFTYEYCAPATCYSWGPSGFYVLGENKVIYSTRNGQQSSYVYTGYCAGDCVVRKRWEYRRTDPHGLVHVVNAYANSFDGTPIVTGAVTPRGQATFRTTPDNSISGETLPEQNARSVTYDARGNIVRVDYLPKPASGETAFAIEAGFDATCSNQVTCNQPNWTEDANGNRTDYVYDPVHGGVRTVTGPAVDVDPTSGVSMVRPQTRYAYGQRRARVLNSSGIHVQSSPIWMLDREAFCRTSAATPTGCTLAGDEVVTTYDYGVTNDGNNLFLRGRLVTADGVSLRTCFSYDRFGNRVSETTPRAGMTSCP